MRKLEEIVEVDGESRKIKERKTDQNIEKGG